MTMSEEKKLTHAIAKFEQTLHANVRIVSSDIISPEKRKVIARLKCFKYVYIFQGEGIVESWRDIS